MNFENEKFLCVYNASILQLPIIFVLLSHISCVLFKAFLSIQNLILAAYSQLDGYVQIKFREGSEFTNSKFLKNLHLYFLFQ